jgi:hypothetical protein
MIPLLYALPSIVPLVIHFKVLYIRESTMMNSSISNIVLLILY